jgi:formylglycine-generating enzyme required for sulfatase activity
MHGNLREWCWDWLDDSGDYSNSPAEDPTGQVSGYDRVMRGGSFMDDGSVLCSAMRDNEFPDTRTFYIGFRVVRP